MKEICHVNALSLYVSDIPRSRAFYQRVFEANITEVDGKNLVVHLGGVMLNMLHESLAYERYDRKKSGLPFEINIWVDDVDAVYETLNNRGVVFLAPPADQPWGMRNITFFDPDGHRFEVAQALR
ncbi:MAG: hypothetical protein GX653_03795 [Clostridiales bacterium]|nr:hypothetical protein [Clostridiales bacterium]